MLNKLLLALALLVLPITSSAQAIISNLGGATATRYHYSSVNRLGAHMIRASPFTREDGETILRNAHDMGITVLRMKIYWSKIETTDLGASDSTYAWSGFANASDAHNNDYDYLFALAHDLGIQFDLVYGDAPAWATAGGVVTTGPPDTIQKWGDFVQVLATRYKPNGAFAQSLGWAATDRIIYSIESFNEPNLDGGNWQVWGGASYAYAREPDRWADFVNKTIIGAHAGDSGLIVVSGPICLYCTPYDGIAFLDDAITAGLTKADVAGFNGYYATASTPTTIFTAMNAKLILARNRYSQNFSGGASVPFWCMECGTAVVQCNGGTNQANTLSAFYDQDGALDQWRLNGRVYIDRVFWSPLLDNSLIDSGDDFGIGGMMFKPITYPPVTAAVTNTATCPIPAGNPITCKSSTCVTSGLIKGGYTRIMTGTAQVP